MASTKKVSDFQNKAQALLDKLEALVNANIKNDGDTSETSQRMCILNNIATVSRSVNGVEPEDFI